MEQQSDVQLPSKDEAAASSKTVSQDLEAPGEGTEVEEEVVHEVSGSETLNSIAAKYDTIPSRLAEHNKLTSRLIFPGQKLRIPPPEPAKKPDDKQAKKKPEHPVYPEEPEMVDAQFVRLNVRHITDGKGIVSGCLLLTPKVVMFNPSLNDPLVQENSDDPDRFQLVSPAELVANFAILKDFARFKTDQESEVDEELIFRPPKVEKIKELRKLERAESEGDVDLPPMYFRLLMGKPIAKKLPRTAPIISYGEQSLEAQYWFIVSQPKALHLYSFISQHFAESHRYGRLDEDAIMRHGLELIRDGAGGSIVEAAVGQTCNRETIAKSLQLHKTLTVTSVDFAEISDMIGESELMSFEERLQLARVMPPRTDGHDWVLKFTTATDGFNLNSFVRKVGEVEGPVLILISDCSDVTFGAFLSSAPRTFSESFQGTGETFVFTLRPHFKKFAWTGENNYFFRLTNESLIVGSGDGNFSIWIDAEFYKGRSQPCSTFDSDPLTTEDFTVKVLECWAFEM